MASKTENTLHVNKGLTQVGDAFLVARKHRKDWHAVYRCACGANIVCRVEHVNAGRKNNCGCSYGATKHRRSSDRIYRVWQGMKDRCMNPNAANFGRYGGRGITVCDRWINSFEAFLQDMGQPPAANMQIDRIANNGGYAPENCRWVTPKQNMANRKR